MNRRIIEDDFLGMSINHNGLIIPRGSIEDFLAKHCAVLGILTGLNDCPVYMPGSATLLKYKNRYVMVCTRHQIVQPAEFEKVCLMIPLADGQTELVTSERAMWIDGVNDGDHEQILVFDFTGSCLNIPELKPMFFGFRRQHPTLPSDRIVYFVTYGYPTDFRNVEYEHAKIELSKRCVRSRFAAAGADEALHNIEAITPLDFDPDGMSGGPTFCIVHDATEGFSVHLAGITVRGGRNGFRVIKAGAVQAMLETVFRD